MVQWCTAASIARRRQGTREPSPPLLVAASWGGGCAFLTAFTVRNAHPQPRAGFFFEL